MVCYYRGLQSTFAQIIKAVEFDSNASRFSQPPRPHIKANLEAKAVKKSCVSDLSSVKDRHYDSINSLFRDWTVLSPSDNQSSGVVFHPVVEPMYNSCNFLGEFIAAYHHRFLDLAIQLLAYDLCSLSIRRKEHIKDRTR